ncbi:hypothetical protein PR003_g763 [Phytophthora rubi]|uniref:RxLR effector protein n=1 Tax=Phytophthora rubi TaxID=129364 RepID=A0A6A3P6A7_9STRA|nr:hypothetical protein PR002_g584 [Phytophthora rubi]KAE9052413.1 hypothetical protein PR001_g526 [Phytophthora rubi]KAE9359392.1 hypothetical protein PR003_g763 [Phytophthora rubi]
MRLHAVVLLALITLLASSNTVSATTQTVSDASKSAVNTSTRFLREVTKANEVANAEERAPNLDIVIKDAATKAKKSTIWKLKFAVWKTILRRTPLEVRAKLGMEGMGRGVYNHKNWDMLMAYHKSYGKGPLKYP